MTSNTHTLAIALCLIADSLEESEDSDLIKTTVVVAAERLEKLEQKRDQLAAQVEQLKAHRKELLDLIYNCAIGQVAMNHVVDAESLAQSAYAITRIDAAGNREPDDKPAQHLTEIRAQAEQQWQPIATAPKDGTMILGYMPSSCHEGLVCVCYWNDVWDHWQNNVDGGSEKPSHWLKLPEPPSAARPKNENSLLPLGF